MTEIITDVGLKIGFIFSEFPKRTEIVLLRGIDNFVEFKGNKYMIVRKRNELKLRNNQEMNTKRHCLHIIIFTWAIQIERGERTIYLFY
jgi:hypothetical protein